MNRLVKVWPCAFDGIKFLMQYSFLVNFLPQWPEEKEQKRKRANWDGIECKKEYYSLQQYSDQILL
jgi:hypothetical protein